jgi:hypothetical protein
LIAKTASQVPQNALSLIIDCSRSRVLTTPMIRMKMITVLMNTSVNVVTLSPGDAANGVNMTASSNITMTILTSMVHLMIGLPALYCA